MKRRGALSDRHGGPDHSRPSHLGSGLRTLEQVLPGFGAGLQARVRAHAGALVGAIAAVWARAERPDRKLAPRMKPGEVATKCTC